MPLYGAPPVKAISASDATFNNTVRITGGPGATVGTDASGVTISASPVGSFWENGVPDPGVQALTLTQVNTAVAGGRLIIQPMTPAAELFPMNITATKVQLNLSGSNTATASASTAFSSTFLIGFYSRVNSTQITLINSASRSIGSAAATGNTQLFHGARWLSFGTNHFSSNPAWSAGARYWWAIAIRTSSFTHGSLSMFGLHHGASSQRSGDLGAVGNSNTSSNAWYPFMGVHSLTTFTAMPISLANSDINKASSLANFIPHLVINAGLALVD